MFRHSFRAVAVVLVTGALTPSAPASADMDPASFINNLGTQLQTVTRSASAEQKLAGFQELFRTDFDVPGLGRFVLGRFWRAFTPFDGNIPPTVGRHNGWYHEISPGDFGWGRSARTRAIVVADAPDARCPDPFS